MKNLKRTLSFLTVVLFTAVFAVVFWGAEASASSLDDLAGIFSTQEPGLSFTEYTPGEDLQLSEDGLNESLTTESSLRDFIVRIVNFALGFLGLLAVVIVIYGGVLYVSSGGEEENTTKGKKAILYATIGLLIVMGSFAFVNTVISGAGGGDKNREFIVGKNTGNSFNASALQVRTVAEKVYGDFLFFAEANEELKGILNDLEKPSLKFEEALVSRQSMMTFLFTLRDKLVNMRSKTIKFSSAYIKINELINQTELYMDRVRNAGGELYVRITGVGGIDFCKDENIAAEVKLLAEEQRADVPKNAYGEIIYESRTEDFFEDFADYFQEAYNSIACDERYYSLYPTDLLTIWSGADGVRVNLTNPDPNDDKSLAYIADAFKDDFLNKLQDSFAELEQLKQSISGIQVSALNDIYEKMIAAYGYNPASPNSYTPNSFMDSINKWILDPSPTQIDQAGRFLFQALELQLEFGDELKKLQSVEAHLRANVTQGNAPLVVTFDVQDSVDPAGGSTIDANIDWSNLAGTATFEGESVDIGQAVRCSTPINQSEQETFGPAFRQCTFKYPGTYVATVSIKSNDPTKYVSGQSTLVIKVDPPTTLINLNMELNDGSAISVMSYYENGILKDNEDYIPVSLSEAKEGINFKVTTKPTNVSNYKWDCGNGQKIDAGTDTMQCVYETGGKYDVSLEILNTLNEVDRKSFTLDVRDLAARIKIVPSDDHFIDTPILLDGNLSSSSSGSIKAYEWNISNNASGKEEDLGADVNRSSFSHEFSEPGVYTVSLRVVSDTNESFSVTKEIEVKSLPPVAVFKHEPVSQNQPASIIFDPSQSYDPDGSEQGLEYEWTISPASENGKNWVWVNGGTNTGLINERTPTIKFKEKGDYDVTLRVTNPTGIDEYSEVTQTVSITNTLDVTWGVDQEVTSIIGEDGKAVVNFKIESDNAIAYEIDFGDGDVIPGDIDGEKTIAHTYDAAGKYTVKVTVFDEEDNDNTITRRIFIGGGDTPIAKIGVAMNGANISDLSDIIEVSKADTLTFDAGESKNVDGTGRRLGYSWDFGDTGRSSNRSATHKYKELSPQDPGYYTAKLKVFDEDNPANTSEDEIKIKVVSKPPTFSSIQAIPDSTSADLVTPVTVTVQAFGVNDDDGKVTQYRWWYYDLDDPDEPLGIQVTQTPNTKLTIGTRGVEGDQVTYGFGLVVTDSDNLTASSEELIPIAQRPTVTVTNGPNKLPLAKFSTDSSNVFTGDSITFSSSSNDPDGNIISYIWDFEGDGFFNNEPTNKATIEHIYKEQNLSGYNVRLKVVDDKGGEGVSEPVKIYVDSIAQPPIAAFKTEAISGSNGLKIRFINNSTADEDSSAEIINQTWDFDTDSALATADSNGDGEKDNDVDSQAVNPERLYTVPGLYSVKLTVTDNQGNSDEVVNSISVGGASGAVPGDTSGLGLGIENPEPTTPAIPEPAPDPLIAVLKTTPAPRSDGIVYLKGDKGTVVFDFSDSVGSISDYTFDKNIFFDGNGNGIKTDDIDFKTIFPGTWTTNFEAAWGKIVVKLTVTDLYGNTHSVTQEIKFE